MRSFSGIISITICLISLNQRLQTHGLLASGVHGVVFQMYPNSIFKLSTLNIRTWCIKNWNSNFSLKIRWSESMGFRFPHGLHQPKWKNIYPSLQPFCHNLMTLDHLPDTMANVRCNLSPRCFRCFLPPSPLNSFISPAWLLRALEFVTSVLRVLQNQLLLNSIWWWRQILHIQNSSTAFPGDAHTLLQGGIRANAFKECPLIRRRSNLTQVFLRGL